MTVSAKVLAYSRHPNPDAPDIITLELYYPQIIHAEVMTHRMFSRNSASFRAKPGKRLRKEIWADLGEPVQYGSANKGMQAAPPTRIGTALGRLAWRVAAAAALTVSAAMERIGLAKEIYNRLVMPFAHMSVVVTATSEGWANFLHLRNHRDADPTIQALAEAVRVAIVSAEPRQLYYDEWHLPYDPEGKYGIMRSVARCARVSYRSFNELGRESTVEEDYKLYQRLLVGNPKHASPAEHQAKPVWDGRGRGNLGQWWMQHRQEIEGEAFFDLDAVLDPAYRQNQER